MHCDKMDQLTLAIFGICTVVAHVSAFPQVLRGVDPKLQSLYSLESTSFKCLDSQLVIDRTRVNDDYCDCIDGSDEPGTSACPNGHFYCKNIGHTPSILNSSFVDDGYCDCCDGSDEASGKCKNTCEEAGAENRAALKRRVSDFSTGLKQRRKYISQAGSQRRKWENELKASKQREFEVQRHVNQLRGQKDRVERIEAEEREASELKRKLAEEQKAAEQPQIKDPQPESSELTDTSPGETTSITDLQAENSGKTNVGSGFEAQQKVLDEHFAKANLDMDPDFREDALRELMGEADLKKETEKSKEALERGNQGETEEKSLTSEEAEAKRLADLEEEGRRIASQWTQDPDAAQSAQKAQEAEETEAPSTEESEPAQEGFHEDRGDVEGSQQSSRGIFAKIKSFFTNQPWDDYDVDSNEKARQAVKDAFNTENNKLSEAQKTKADLERKLQQDFGPDDVFLTLTDRCVQTNVDKYIYEVCWFGSANQKDGGMSISLGHFRRFEDNFRTMIFDGGQGCWNGPARSIKVALECGKKEELSHVEEPNKCEYHAKLTTPAVCSEEEHKSLTQEIKLIEDQSADKQEL